MHLSYAILAEAADISRSGKLALIGGNSEVLNAAAFPVTLPMLTLVASLTVDAVECEVEHSATLQVLAADGSDLLPSTAHRFTPHANPPETAALPVRFVLLVNLAGTTLPAAGTYLIRLNVDGKEVGSIPILALHAADMQPSTPSPSEVDVRMSAAPLMDALPENGANVAAFSVAGHTPICATVLNAHSSADVVIHPSFTGMQFETLLERTLEALAAAGISARDIAAELPAARARALGEAYGQDFLDELRREYEARHRPTGDEHSA